MSNTTSIDWGHLNRKRLETVYYDLAYDCLGLSDEDAVKRRLEPMLRQFGIPDAKKVAKTICRDVYIKVCEISHTPCLISNPTGCRSRVPRHNINQL